MLHPIAEKEGEALAAEVAVFMLYCRVLGLEAPHTDPVQARLGMRNAPRAQALRFMEESLEQLIDIPELSGPDGLSVRQIERRFARHPSTSPKRHYTAVRVERARRRLVQSDLAVVEVALTRGFDSPTHFGKRCRQNLARRAAGRGRRRCGLREN